MPERPLTEAIDALYAVFERHPRPARFAACGCCWAGEVVPNSTWRGTQRPVVMVDAPGGDRPLRELALEEIGDIGTDVPLTGGSLAVLKHYLPRLCELLAVPDPGVDWPDLHVVLSRLSDDPDVVGGEQWWNWPEDERSAIESFLWSLWRERRRGTPALADETLAAIGLAVPDIRPYLDGWEQDEDIVARSSLRDFQATSTTESLADPWWDTDHEPGKTNADRVRTWLLTTQAIQT